MKVQKMSKRKSKEKNLSETSDPVWTNDIANYFTKIDVQHMSARGVYLDSYMWVSMNYPRIIGKIETKVMPPGGWTDDRIARFKLWAKNGWPEK
jgi:hypothetical protein